MARNGKCPLLRFPLWKKCLPCQPKVKGQPMGEGLTQPHTKSGQLYPQNQAQRLGKRTQLLGISEVGLSCQGCGEGAIVSPAQLGPANSATAPGRGGEPIFFQWVSVEGLPLTIRGLPTQTFHPG